MRSTKLILCRTFFFRFRGSFLGFCLALSVAAGPVVSSGANAEPYRPLDHIWYGTRDIPTTQNLVILGAGTGATLGALFWLDDRIVRFYAGQNRMGGADWVGNHILGTGAVGATLGVGAVVYGIGAQRPHELESGEAHLEGLLGTFAYTSALKFSVRRQRPGDGNRQSFPSGHTSTMFSSAANLLDFYGPIAGVPAFALGVYTGMCRLNSNAHHLSDVLFGATLGYIVGHAYDLHHLVNVGEKGGLKTELSFYPYYDDRANFGGAFELKF